MKRYTQAGMVAALLLSMPAARAEVRSVSRIEFGPPGTLFVADWKSASVHAIAVPSGSTAPKQAFNLLKIQPALEAALQTRDVTVEDLKVRPGTQEVYLAVSYGPDALPAVLRVDSDGSVHRIDLDRESSPAIPLRDAPTGDAAFWSRIPVRSMTVSDMRWHDGKLYIAGLSNQSFSSSLRIAAYPGDGVQTLSSIAMYHTAHDQTETRAPIRTMTFMTIGGTDYLIAAYLCTPLVAIPVGALRDGAHVTGKTIAELGYGNTPIDMVPFQAPDEKGKLTDYVLVTNVNRNAETITVASIAEAVARPGLDKPVPWSAMAGVNVVQAPIAGAIAADSLDETHFVMARRDPQRGDLQVVSVQKGIKIRVSDFVSEYDFPSYAYPPGKQTTFIKPIEDAMMHEEGYAAPFEPRRR